MRSERCSKCLKGVHSWAIAYQGRLFCVYCFDSKAIK